MRKIEPMIYHQRIKLPYRYVAGEANTVFLRGLESQEIFGSTCSTCSQVVVPARPFCPTCSGHLEEHSAVAQEGSLTSFTLCGDGSAIGMIQLDGTDTHFPHRVASSEPQIGMRVRAKWTDEPVAEITSIQCFEPI